LDCIQSLKITTDTFEPHPITFEQYLEQGRKKWIPTPDIPLSQGLSTFAVNQNNMTMQKVTINPFYLIGIPVKTTNENGQAAKDLAKLWGTFVSKNISEAIPNKMDSEVYSVYTDFEGDHTQPYTAILGCKVHNLDTIPEGMVGKSFEGGAYLQTTAKGDLMKGLVASVWAGIWDMELDRAFTTDFEIYGEKARNPSAAEVDFLIAVK